MGGNVESDRMEQLSRSPACEEIVEIDKRVNVEKRQHGRQPWRAQIDAYRRDLFRCFGENQTSLRTLFAALISISN
jgi:hypothetical protein